MSRTQSHQGPEASHNFFCRKPETKKSSRSRPADQLRYYLHGDFCEEKGWKRHTSENIKEGIKDFDRSLIPSSSLLTFANLVTGR